MKALGGKADAPGKRSDKAAPANGKSKDELAAEEIAKALRSGK